MVLRAIIAETGKRGADAISAARRCHSAQTVAGIGDAGMGRPSRSGRFPQETLGVDQQVMTCSASRRGYRNGCQSAGIALSLSRPRNKRMPPVYLRASALRTRGGGGDLYFVWARIDGVAKGHPARNFMHRF
jgi:hypothetical protein